MASNSSAKLDEVDIESQSQEVVMVSAARTNSSSSFRGKWRLFLVVHRASRQLLNAAKADKADQKSSENTSTDHIHVWIPDVSFDGPADPMASENRKSRQESIAEIVKSGDLAKLRSLGGVHGVVKALGRDLQKGIGGDEEDLCSRRVNDALLSEGRVPSQGRFLRILLRACNNSIIFFLIVSAVLSIGFGIDEQGLRTGWWEGAVIVLAIIVLVALSSLREYWNEKTSKMLENQKSQEKREVAIDVVRGGNRLKMSVSDVVFGDIVCLRRGCEVPSDGLFISEGYLELDDGPVRIDGHNPFLYYGSKVIKGDGLMLVTSVGMATSWGDMMSKVNNGPAKITLPTQLDKVSLATQVIGLSISILILVVVFLRYKLGKGHQQDSGAPEIKGKPVSMEALVDNINRTSFKPRGSVNILMTSLIMLVVGLAEGVPFIVSLAVNYWNKEVRKAKAGDVKEPLACVGMGTATTICTGKTGGLTLGSDKVDVLCIDGEVIREETALDTRVLEALLSGIGALVLRQQRPGSSIEDPILSWATLKLGFELENWKESCTIIETCSWEEGSRVLMRKKDKHEVESHKCLHLSGPAKTILTKSSHYYDSQGTVNILDDDKRYAFEQNIERMRSNNLKTMAFACTMEDSPTFEDHDGSLILIGLIGLKHVCPVKTQKAMKAFIGGDVKIILISEDDVSVLEAIGLEFGLLNGEVFRNLTDEQRRDIESGLLNDSERSFVLDGEVFRSLTDAQRRRIVNDICVIGNCLPRDKLLLVQCLKQEGHMVAMIGTRTNDIPAQKEANLGIAMRIGSSESAKECSEIIISDENFNSLVTIISYGRCAYNNIRKYIQFEITMFVAWLLVSTITTSAFGDAPITTFQWLWANLIVSIAGGLALLTEPPSKRLMEKPPVRQTDPFITKSMWRAIMTQALFQATILVAFQFTSQATLKINKKVCKTMIFNSFVLCQVFNLLNSRKLKLKNMFKSIYWNLWFLAAVEVILLLQLTFIEIAHSLVGNARLNGEQWGICVLIGMLSLLSDFATKGLSTLVKYFSYRFTH